MPFYDMACQRCDHEQPVRLSYAEFDKKAFPEHCSEPMVTKINLPTFYGAWRIGDKDFKDATEASMLEIKSAKDIDKLERGGVMYPITNPSRHRSRKG